MTEQAASRTRIDSPTGPSATLAVRKRDGRVVAFDGHRIRVAIEKAFKAERGETAGSESTKAVAESISHAVIERFLDQVLSGEMLAIETIQDAVEKELMRQGHYEIARRYIVYREERKRSRALRGDTDLEGRPVDTLTMEKVDGTRVPLTPAMMQEQLSEACQGCEPHCEPDTVLSEFMPSLYDGISETELERALVLAARAQIEKEPAYTYVTARLLLHQIYREVWERTIAPAEVGAAYARGFEPYVEQGIVSGLLTPELLHFDLPRLAAALQPDRDRRFTYAGLQTLHDRYFLRRDERRVEAPQYFWMRVAMGLAIREGARAEEQAIAFYQVLSSFDFIPSTPTLLHAGTPHPQLSSCYLSTIMDDLEHIFKVISDDATLSKWSGGLGNDWTNVRAAGSHIRGTNGRSRGVIPFLKVANETAAAVNQGGRRQGAMCAYLETWHLDMDDFLELHKHTGDARRRTHDMNTAHWIPDVFIKRVRENGSWTLFSPSETPELHDLYGRDFERRYEAYEAMADQGEVGLHKRVKAVDLWRKMLTMLLETGHPWLAFKDPSNIRSPQDHAGVVHSSNPCTEILLNTAKDETAACNQGTINLVQHTTREGIDEEKLARTVRTAMRMLDNVIDINFYPTPETRKANLRHRPIGLGLMGFQDALYRQDISYASEEAITFADRSMEMVSYYAILASSELAEERGRYASYEGSKWSRGLLPIDSIDLLEQERGIAVDMDRGTHMDWTRVRASVRKHGMRNSNTMAMAPTTTISSICGVSPSMEPAYHNLCALQNLSGTFAWANPYLVDDLRKLGLWDEEMLSDLKRSDGSVRTIERIPAALRQRYMTAFEIDPKWLMECASRRQKWLDMGHALNLYLSEPSLKKLSDLYMFAWLKGLKSTYHLHTLGATAVEDPSSA